MGANGTIRFERVPPEPGRFWIRHRPTHWPGPPGWWIDLARAEPAVDQLQSKVLPGGIEGAFEDVVYVPPLEPAGELLRQEIVHRCSELGVPIVQQVLPGDPAPVGEGPIVADLTESLLRGRPEDLAVPPGAWAVWPLIPGLTDRDEVRSRGLERLAAAGAAGVLPMPLALSPQQRRRLAEIGPAASYSDLFHGDQAASLQIFAASVRGLGLEVFPGQPPLSGGRRAPNRALAAHFSLLAELWLGCSRPPGRAQVFYDVARRLADERVDVAELARRGGLAGIDWLDAASRDEIRGVAEGERTPLMSELEAEFFAGTG